jgi:hypothetical protein
MSARPAVRGAVSNDRPYRDRQCEGLLVIAITAFSVELS